MNRPTYTPEELETRKQALEAKYTAQGVPANMVAALATANAPKPLALVNSAEILSALRDGEAPRALATRLGVSRQALYEWLLSEHATEWSKISSARSLARIEDAENDLDEANDQVQVSRARASAGAAQWNLEKTARRLYGDPKDMNTGLTINVIVDRNNVVIETSEMTEISDDRLVPRAPALPPSEPPDEA